MYFSGFCFKGEKEIFKDYIDSKAYNISGFSYGAQKAFEYAYNKMKNKQRVNKITLLSPAFFQNKSTKYKQLQLEAFNKDSSLYLKNFLESIGEVEKRYIQLGTLEQLKELLTYEWNHDKIKEILDFGCELEVYLGGRDKIIDAYKVLKFFSSYAVVYLNKEANHLLQD